MNINSSTKNYERGQIVQAAQAILELHSALLRSDYVSTEVEKRFDNELIRLMDNQLQIRNAWGDLVQLSMLIVFLTEGYVPCLKE